MVSWIAPKDIHVLSLGPVNVTSYGKRDFADVIRDYGVGPM